MLTFLCIIFVQKLVEMTWPEVGETPLQGQRAAGKVNLPLRFLTPKDKHCQFSRVIKGSLHWKYEESNHSRY